MVENKFVSESGNSSSSPFGQIFNDFSPQSKKGNFILLLNLTFGVCTFELTTLTVDHHFQHFVFVQDKRFHQRWLTLKRK